MMSFKKNLGALVIIVVLLLALYGVIMRDADPVTMAIALQPLGLGLFGLKSYTGIKAKNIEATMEGSNGNQGTDK